MENHSFGLSLVNKILNSHQFMKTILPILFLFLVLSTINAQNFVGEYAGQYNGDNIHLTLKADGVGKLSGQLKDSGQKYTVSATNEGSNISGTVKNQTLDISMDFSGKLNGDALSVKLTYLGVDMNIVLNKVGQASNNPTVESNDSKVPMPKLPSNAQHDKALIGTWVRQENYNSGAGMDGYYSNTSYLAFNADGSLSDLGVEMVAGSYSGSAKVSRGEKGVLPGVKWYTENKSLYLLATDGVNTETVRLGKYYLENGALLITADNGTKVLYYRH